MSLNEDFDIFDIDQHRLDREWLNQPRLYREWGEKLADARRDLEQAKAELDLVAAELDRDVRSDPTRFGIVKVTEGVVEKTVLLQREHRDAHNKVIRAKHKVDVLSTYQTALDHRKKALENLVQLFLASYFSEPRTDSRGREAIDGRTKARRTKGVKPR